jgi:uncharacterized protein DUF1572
MPSADEFATAVVAAAAHELDSAWAKLKHCLDQLTEPQIWHRPGAGQNSIANLLLHLNGNLRQWIIVGLDGGKDERNRPQEFADDSGRPKAQLIAALDDTIREAKNVLARQTAADLVRIRRIQGSNVTGLAAIFDAIPHFRGHTQEIVFRTRLLLGDQYRFAWQPTTKEQGA